MVKTARFFLITLFLFITFKAIAQDQETNQDSAQFQIGLRSFLNPFYIKYSLIDVRLAGQIQYLKNGNRWTIGYQYFPLNHKIRKGKNPKGPIVEGDFLSIDFTNRLRLGFPFRLALLFDHYYRPPRPENLNQDPIYGGLSGGANLHYEISKRWELGLKLGYIGYFRNVKQLNQKGFFFIDGTGLSVHYRF